MSREWGSLNDKTRELLMNIGMTEDEYKEVKASNKKYYSITKRKYDSIAAITTEYQRIRAKEIVLMEKKRIAKEGFQEDTFWQTNFFEVIKFIKQWDSINKNCKR